MPELNPMANTLKVIRIISVCIELTQQESRWQYHWIWSIIKKYKKHYVKKKEIIVYKSFISKCYSLAHKTSNSSKVSKKVIVLFFGIKCWYKVCTKINRTLVPHQCWEKFFMTSFWLLPVPWCFWNSGKVTC